MNAITPDVSLADLVIARPELAVRFDSLGLDYCCGGKSSLAEASAEAGLDVEALIVELSAVPVAPEAPADWDDMIGLVNHLESTHHSYLRSAMPRLVELGDKVAGVHGDRHPELNEIAQLIHDLEDDLMPHLVKEERVLFPMIRELSGATTAPTFHCGSVGNPIRVMLAEHDNVGDLLARLRMVTRGYEVPPDGCASYHALYSGLAELEADTHQHVHKENNLLFPAVAAAEESF